MNAPPPVKKIPVIEGRASLRARGFEQGPSAGSRGELWISKTGQPAFVSYVGPRFGEDFSAESLAKALLLVDN